MRRRMALLVAVTAVSGVMTMFSPTSTPAQADVHGACVGVVGNAHLHDTLTYPTHGPSKSASFTFHFDPAVCVDLDPPGVATTISATGTVHGWCGLSTGSGVTSTGTTFGWVGVGGDLVLTGGLSGDVHATPNLATGDSCTTGADDFVVSGAAVGHSCTVGVSVPPTTTPHHTCV